MEPMRMSPSLAASPVTIEVATAIDGITATEWDRLAHGPRKGENIRPPNGMEGHAESCPQQSDPPPENAGAEDDEAGPAPEAAESPSEEDEANPFISHAFLSALEHSGSVGGRTGWAPRHLIARDAAGRIIGAVPAYAKSHSRGEYVFDHAFAEAFARAGGRYYPKLQVSVPFTPARARKLLIAPDAAPDATRAVLIGGLEALRARIEASSIHATFLTTQDRHAFKAGGFLLRTDQQFHFLNRGYATFEDFLAALASRKRKVLKRERREALANGITVEWVTGKDLTEAHWDAFFAFYIDTGNRKWGSPYLTRAFFSRITETMADKTLLVMARREGRYIAGALNFIGQNTLYGRNWGAIEHHPFLHFEICYYQAIDFALAHGLARVEAGAQGEHKLARGYQPVKTWSVHHFADAGFQRAVAGYLAREREAVDEAQAELETLTPFRRGPPLA
jgi:uncharacterized protein